MMTYVALYLAAGVLLVAQAAYRARHTTNWDPARVFLSLGLVVAWPAALVLDLVEIWCERRQS